MVYQLQRASLSVQLNIAEGFAYGDSATYTRFLGIAYGSAVEALELLEPAAGAEIFRLSRLKISSTTPEAPVISCWRSSSGAAGSPRPFARPLPLPFPLSVP